MNAFARNAFSRPSAFTSAFGVAGDAFEGRVLYFVGTAADEDWSTLGNWFNDRAGTSAAASIPEAGDRVYLLDPIGTGPAAPITLDRVYVEGENVNLDGVTASRFAFSGVGADFFGSITGPVLVYWPVVVPLTGTVTGTVSYVGYAQDPTGFVAVGADSIVNLTWDDPGIDAVVGLRYRIYRGLTSTFSAATLLAENIDALLYDDAAVTNDTTYYYWLQVYYSNGSSAFVGPESATPEAAAGDPLLARPHIAYWHGFKETDPATSGLYLDTACTTPITDEWDLVAGIKYNGVIFATQSTEAARPYAARASDGTWYCLFDGIDDWLDPALTMGGQVTYSVIMRSVTSTWNTFWSPLGILENTDVASRWGHVHGGGFTFWDNAPYPAEVSRDGLPLSVPFDCAPIDEWMSLTVKTSEATATPFTRSIGSYALLLFGNFELAGMFIHVVDPDPADVAAVDAEFIARIPT